MKLNTMLLSASLTLAACGQTNHSDLAGGGGGNPDDGCPAITTFSAMCRISGVDARVYVRTYEREYNLPKYCEYLKPGEKETVTYLSVEFQRPGFPRLGSNPDHPVYGTPFFYSLSQDLSSTQFNAETKVVQAENLIAFQRSHFTGEMTKNFVTIKNIHIDTNHTNTIQSILNIPTKVCLVV